MHQIYSDGLLKLKNMDWCLFIYAFNLGYLMRTQYMIYQSNRNINAKTLLKNLHKK